MTTNLWFFETVFQHVVTKLMAAVNIRGHNKINTIFFLLTCIIWPVPLPSPGVGISHCFRIGACKSGFISHGSMATSPAIKAIS